MLIWIELRLWRTEKSGLKTPFAEIILAGLEVIVLRPNKYKEKTWKWFYDGTVLSKFMRVLFGISLCFFKNAYVLIRSNQILYMPN